MTPRISTGRERRVRQTKPVIGHDGVPRYTRDNEDGKMSWDERTSQDRRVASYRGFLQARVDEAEGCGMDAPVTRDLILALRKPESVVVAEGVIDTSGDWPVIRTGGAFGVIQFASWLKKDAQHGHCVRVVVEKCDE